MRISQCLRLVSGLLLGASFCQCAPKESALSVQVKNWPAAATRLRVLSTFAGQSKLPGKTFFIEPGTAEFAVYVPSEVSGRAVVEGIVEDSAGCYVAGQITQADFTDRPSVQRVDLDLKVYETRQCPVQSYSKLEKIWMDRPDNAWTVGENGTILRWNGAAWLSTIEGRDEYITGVWGGTFGEVWVVGTKGLILRWDGSAWTQKTSGTSTNLSAIWGSNEADLWAVGEVGTTLRWNGTNWRNVPILSLPQSPIPYLTAVWGSAPSNVWIIGTRGFIVHWDGASWSPPYTLATDEPQLPKPQSDFTLTRIHGLSAENILISSAGVDGYIIRLTGNQWKLNPVSPISSGQNLYALWMADQNNAWAGGTTRIYKNNGNIWRLETGVNASDVNFKDIAGADVFQVIAVGYKFPSNVGVFRYWNGTTWSEVPNF